jgi:aryl-alcohol dehydrogenase-like predicted oxidoreductase
MTESKKGDFSEPVILGRTGLRTSRLGIGATYGVSAKSIESAFHEYGINYLYWGTIRHPKMGKAIRNLSSERDKIIVAIQTYSRVPFYIPISVNIALKRLHTSYADILILGMFNNPPSDAIMEKALSLKDRGIVKFLAISAHRRATLRKYIEDGIFDVVMVRYNAAHRGAETEVFPYLPKKDKPGVVCYTATRWGHLMNPRYVPTGERVPRASDCYRFILSNPHVHLCMSGPKNENEMDEALKALRLGSMSEEEIEWMRRVGDHIHRVAPKPPFSVNIFSFLMGS